MKNKKFKEYTKKILEIYQKLYVLITKVLKTKKIEYVFLFVILLIGFVVRLYKINNPVADWHSWRQADTASVSRIYAQKGIDVLYPKYYDISTAQSGLFNPEGYRFVEFPLYNVINVVFYRLLPVYSIEVWARLISIFSALFTSVFIFLIARKYLDKWAGIFAAGFYLLIPYNIYFTRVILPEPMSTLFSIMGVWFFIKFWENERNKWLYLSAFFYNLAILLKPYTLFYGFPVIYLLIKKYGVKNLFKEKKYYLAGLIAFFPFLLWRSWISQYPEGIPFWKWAFNGNKIRFRPSFWNWIFGERLGRLILGIWGLVPFAIGILNYNKKKPMIHLLGISMFLYVSVVASANVMHDYYQTMTIPVIALFFASGSSLLWRGKVFSKFLSKGILVFSTVVMMVVGAYRVRDFFSVNHPEIVLAGQKADEILPKDALIIAPYNGDTAFLYQTKRSGWPVIDRPLDELIEKGAQYFVSVNYDDVTNKVIKEYEVVFKNESFVIANLTMPIKSSQQ